MNHSTAKEGKESKVVVVPGDSRRRVARMLAAMALGQADDRNAIDRFVDLRDHRIVGQARLEAEKSVQVAGVAEGLELLLEGRVRIVLHRITPFLFPSVSETKHPLGERALILFKFEPGQSSRSKWESGRRGRSELERKANHRTNNRARKFFVESRLCRTFLRNFFYLIGNKREFAVSEVEFSDDDNYSAIFPAGLVLRVGVREDDHLD